MSEGGGSAGPDIGPNYQNSGAANYSNPPSQPPTPSSTVQDPPNYQSAEVSENSNDSKPNITTLHSSSASGLPPFSSFAASDVTEGLGGRLAGDGYLTSDGISSTRVMELSGWDYCYTDGLSGRYLERGDSMPVMIPQPQYRPWESKQDGSSDNGKSTLPSFQSQFGEELVTTLTTLTPAACSPAPSVPSPSLPSFHTLSAVNPRYPLVPAPVQAREIPSIQQQFLDERHIHLFQGPPGQNFTLQPQNGLNGQTLTTLNNAQYHPQIINNAQILPSGQIIAPQSHILTPNSQIITSNGHIITSSGGQGLAVVSQNSTPTVLTVVKTEPVNIVELKSSSTEPSNLTQLHHTNFQNPLITQGQQMDSKFGLESPPRGIDGRKKERRKIRASSLESSNESDGAMSVESSGQVAAVSSTAGFKSPMTPGQMNNEGDGMITDTGEKQTKKKRKRCGECIGCQRKDNCGDCAPCRNDKSHQICKMRRCEKLTEKKHLLAYNREDGGVSYRGRGRGRGRGSRGGYRGKGARPGAQSAQANSVVGEMNSAPGLVVGSSRDAKAEGGRVSSGPIPANPALAPTMAVPFYAGTEVWSASTPADPWATQGQFIHQIDDIRYQHYPGYQTAGYQQGGFVAEQSSAFQPQYGNPANGNPASSPAQGNVTPRSTGSYTQVHTPTPSPNPSTPHVNGHRNGINVHYVEENYVNGTTFNTESSMVPPASTTPNSRSSSVHLEASESNSKTSNYMSGNEIPGYPLNSPQCQSSCNSSGYPGQSVQSEYGDQSANGNSYQVSNGTNHATQKTPTYSQAGPGTYQNYQNYNQVNAEEHPQNAMTSTSVSPGSCHPSQKTSGMYPQSSPKSYNSNPSPQTYQQISPGHNRNATVHYENRTMGNGNPYQSERFDQQNYPIPSPSSQNYGQSSPNNSDKSNVNARIKSMIMSKHQMSQNHQQNLPNNNFSGSNENQMMSPNRELISPAQHNVQIMSPMHQMMSPQSNHLISANQMTSPNPKDPKGGYMEKIQQNDYGEKKHLQINENANHFLAFSHHLREGRVLQPEGGGVQNWTAKETCASDYQFHAKTNYCDPFQTDYGDKRYRKNVGPSAMENFIKFASEELGERQEFPAFEAAKKQEGRSPESPRRLRLQTPDPIRNLEENFPTRRSHWQGNVKTENLENGRDCGGCQTSVFPDFQGDFCSRGEDYSYLKTVVKKEDFRGSGQPPRNRLRSDSWIPRSEWSRARVKSEPSGPIRPFHSSCHFRNVKMEKEDLKRNCVANRMEYPTTQLLCDERLEEQSKNRLSPATENKFGDSSCPRIMYAPNFKNMKVVDRRFPKDEEEGKTKWKEYQKARETEKGELVEIKREKENYLFPGDGGPVVLEKASGTWCCRMGGTETPTAEHLKDGVCQGLKTADEFSPDREKSDASSATSENGGDLTSTSSSRLPCGTERTRCKSPGGAEGQDAPKDFQENVERLRNNLRADVPDCRCFPPDKCPPEPGSYYTHLGAASSLSDLRKDIEERTGQTGNALRIEKICYTGKEGKTTQGCPLAKWVIRRSGEQEKFLIVVKHRQGHTCSTAWIVVCLVAWEGIPTSEADKVYALLSHKLNRFGLPTTRRCATNEPRTCACQGLDPDTCGASFSFGCSWSMYYNGCKYARSKTVRKFRLSVRSEEQEVEERMHVLATLLSPLYSTLAPDAFHNQTLFEREASECRLGFKPGRPFSGVTACIDFCAHSHRDLHNMNNGCTVVVTLTKHRTLSKPEDEQLHVLPLYVMDDTDEFGCKESQEAKYRKGTIECLNKFPCEVRVRAVPLQPCRRHGKKRKDEESDVVVANGKLKEPNPKNSSPPTGSNSASPMQQTPEMHSMLDGLELQLQSSQVSSTVLDSPVGTCQGWSLQSESEVFSPNRRWNSPWTGTEGHRNQNWFTASDPPTRWEYSPFGADGEVDPDSTTHQNQAYSPMSSQTTGNPHASKSRLKGGGGSSSLTTGCYPQSLSPWSQVQQVNKDEDAYGEREEKVGGGGARGLWVDRSPAPPPLRQSASPFRVPRGRPPPAQSAANLAFEQSETFIKPLPKDVSETSLGFVPCCDGAKAFDVPENGEGHWCPAFGRPETSGRGSFSQNPCAADAVDFHARQHGPGEKNDFSSSPVADSYYCHHQMYESCDGPRKRFPCESWTGSGDVGEDPCHGYRRGDATGAWTMSRWDPCGPSTFFPAPSETPKSEPIGEVTDFVENEECFRDSQMGGVAIALGHGSVLFECAKHELHATTALKKPNRTHPTRISLVFYQHRNLNRAKHGWDEWEEKMRLRKLGINSPSEKSAPRDANNKLCNESINEILKLAGLEKPLGLGDRILLRAPTSTTTTWTTLFPMRPCTVTGPYQEGGND